MVTFFPIIIIFSEVVKCVSTNTSYFEITACYHNTSTTDINKTKPRLIDVNIGSIVHLWCHFCEEKNDYHPKLWYYKPRGNLPSKKLIEIKAYDLTNNITTTPIHILNINYFNANNSGIYVCKSSEIKKGTIFRYILEGVINVVIKPKIGTPYQWHEYKRSYIESINKKFKISEEEPYKSLRKNIYITYKLSTVWEKWGECKEVDHQKGIRKRLGRCRLSITINNNSQIMPMNINSHLRSAFYLVDGFDIPCRSLRLNKTLPELSKIIRNIPEYEAEEACHVLKKTAKHRVYKDKYKHKTMMQVAENSHVTLSCSDVLPNTDLKWFKDEKRLNSVYRNNMCKNEEEPHITVDTNNSLHILHISKNEEGNYSCLVNGKKIQEFEVKVVSKSKLLNQEFIRYSIYLGFVLSLTMTCYCAGVCVAWHRRSSFADPLHLNKKRMNDFVLSRHEKEKLLK